MNSHGTRFQYDAQSGDTFSHLPFHSSSLQMVCFMENIMHSLDNVL